MTIYSGASVLGGQTVIGHGSVIGSNAFVTSSIKPDSRVTNQNQELHMSGGTIEKEDLQQDDNWIDRG